MCTTYELYQKTDGAWLSMGQQTEYGGRYQYKAGSTCDRCDLQPCPAGHYREKCTINMGTSCLPCSNGIPAAARYSTPGNPIHTDFCQWNCKGIYDRSGDKCTLGRGAILASVISGVTLLSLCILTVSYNAFKRFQTQQSTVENLVRYLNSNHFKLFH